MVKGNHKQKAVAVLPLVKSKLYFGRGNVPDGFTKIDLGLDKSSFPSFQYADETVEEIVCEHMFHLVPGHLRGKFMDEIYRLLIPTGKLSLSVPYYNHMRAVQDFMHAWPPICEASFLYFNKQWRETNRIEYQVACDFDFSYGYSVEADTAGRNEETRSFWLKHYVNAATDLQVVMTKRLPANARPGLN
jgi:hypothetical protein